MVNFLGEHVLESEESDGVFLVELNKDKMMETRLKLDFLSDRDDFEIQE